MSTYDPRQSANISAMAMSSSMAAGAMSNAQNFGSEFGYTLEIIQQPERARMCGFGDKDRRPITPPPCVRLVIRDTRTGQEVDYSTIDAQHFVLSVDIWDKDGATPANEVKHSNTSPSISISMASVTSYPPPPDHMAVNPYVYGNAMRGGYASQYGGANYGYGAHPPYTGAYTTAQPGSFQRNLIGSLSVSASYLQDTNGKYGYWFILQDLSVRTEGTFRLRLSFMNLTVAAQNSANIPGVNHPMRIPIMATVFTDTFQVFSAKRFPGVKESTELSKRFAAQGVKIPIRKDGGGTKKRGSDDDAADED